MKKYLLLALLAATASVGAMAQDEEQQPTKTYTVQKISNPACGERQIDGLVPGGDRANSYTWRLAMRDDEIYVATTRNIANALVNMYAPSFTSAGISTDTFWAMIDAVTNGDIPRDASTDGAHIICYNRTTGDFKVVYTAEPTVYFRMAVTFGDDVYFGSYSADPRVAQYILKLDRDGNFTKVFQTMGSVSLRANCEYDGHLFFAGADDREVVEGDRIPTKLAVLRKSNTDDTVWERVADYKDFGEIPFDPIQGSWAGAPIWELANHNGYIYATAPSTQGFVIFRGHPAQGDEVANEYGWYWEEVAGLNNGINNPGLSDIEGGEPGTMRSLIGSVYEFNGELYAYNFDHSFGGEAAAFAGIMQQIAGQDVKASNYLFYLYNSLQNPQKVWKLDDTTGKFVECKNFTSLTEGTTNEYVWRMGEYDGDLYISTMDAGIFYGYLTQLTNGSFFTMTPEERATKIEYIKTLIDILLTAKGNELADSLREKLEQLKAFLDQFVEAEQVDENTVVIFIHLQELLNEVFSIIEDYINSQLAGDTDNLARHKLRGDSQNALSEDLLRAMAQISNLPDDYIDNLVAEASQQLSTTDYDVVQNRLDLSLRDIITAALDLIRDNMQQIYDKIDLEGIQMYLYINRAVVNNEWGFDLMRTSDGENFEVITRTGFNDKYNYGCSAFLATDEGLYIGTCNPFYGGQLYLLTNDVPDTGINDVVDARQLNDAKSDVYYTPLGQRIEGRPTTAGIYINAGKVVVVK